MLANATPCRMNNRREYGMLCSLIDGLLQNIALTQLVLRHGRGQSKHGDDSIIVQALAAACGEGHDLLQPLWCGGLRQSESHEIFNAAGHVHAAIGLAQVVHQMHGIKRNVAGLRFGHVRLAAGKQIHQQILANEQGAGVNPTATAVPPFNIWRKENILSH